MIIKKRKRKKKSSKLKKPRDPSTASLNSLPTNHKLIEGTGERESAHLPIIKKEEKSKKFLKLIVYINEFDRIDEKGKLKCRNNDCEHLVCKPFRKYCSRKCSEEFTK